MPSTGNAIASSACGGTEHVQQRQIVLRRRHGQQRVLAERSVVDQRRVVARDDELANFRLEARGPVVGLDGMPAPRIRVQVVHDVSAAHDQHACIPQRTQALADLIVKLRRARFVDAQLYDRYIRVRKDMAQHGPRAVIETPARRRGRRRAARAAAAPHLREWDRLAPDTGRRTSRSGGSATPATVVPTRSRRRGAVNDFPRTLIGRRPVSNSYRRTPRAYTSSARVDRRVACCLPGAHVGSSVPITCPCAVGRASAGVRPGHPGDAEVENLRLPLGLRPARSLASRSRWGCCGLAGPRPRRRRRRRTRPGRGCSVPPRPSAY